jgi:uncharacterized protein (TIGR01244 family)
MPAARVLFTTDATDVTGRQAFMALNEIKQIGPNLWICPQLRAEDFEAVAAQGFRAVINARPDFEGGAEQPESSELQAAAARAGLCYEYLPVVPNQITETDVAAFAQQLEDLPAPVLAFCRTGNRCSILWSLVQQRNAGQS